MIFEHCRYNFLNYFMNDRIRILSFFFLRICSYRNFSSSAMRPISILLNKISIFGRKCLFLIFYSPPRAAHGCPVSLPGHHCPIHMISHFKKVLLASPQHGPTGNRNAWFTFSLGQHETRREREYEVFIRLVFHTLDLFSSCIDDLGDMLVNQS